MQVLDSSALIEVIEQGHFASEVHHILDDQPLVTTSITVHELLSGKISDKKLFILESLFSQMRILQHDTLAAKCGAKINRELSRAGSKINDLDVLIAGVCQASGAELVTLDNDFAKIKGFKATIIGKRKA